MSSRPLSPRALALWNLTTLTKDSLTRALLMMAGGGTPSLSLSVSWSQDVTRSVLSLSLTRCSLRVCNPMVALPMAMTSSMPLMQTIPASFFWYYPNSVEDMPSKSRSRVRGSRQCRIQTEDSQPLTLTKWRTTTSCKWQWTLLGYPTVQRSSTLPLLM